jgi:phosphoribosylformimino-5-aminoimidazole carboxamide ribotide isomerase
MRIIPVLDLKEGRVVRAVGGRRSEYRPIISRLVDGATPGAVTAALAAAFRPRELYVADLDAIAGAPPAIPTYGEIRQPGVALWVDAGVREARDAEALAAAGVDGIILGLESVRGPESVRAAMRTLGPARVLFSLDLRGGTLLGDWAAWGVSRASPLTLAGKVADAGVRRVIVLDLARVGGGQGTGTGPLCRSLTSAFPGLEVFAGGGVRGPEDVRDLEACGAAGVLVASALHDGRIASFDCGR